MWFWIFLGRLIRNKDLYRKLINTLLPRRLRYIRTFTRRFAVSSAHPTSTSGSCFESHTVSDIILNTVDQVVWKSWTFLAKIRRSNRHRHHTISGDNSPYIAKIRCSSHHRRYTISVLIVRNPEHSWQDQHPNRWRIRILRRPLSHSDVSRDIRNLIHRNSRTFWKRIAV